MIEYVKKDGKFYKTACPICYPGWPQPDNSQVRCWNHRDDAPKMKVVIGAGTGTMTQGGNEISQQYARELARQVDELEAENAKLRAALRDAHGLIDNDLVAPWVMAHKLDDILNEQNASPAKSHLSE